MRADTEQWWEQARADLVSARGLLAIGQFYAVSLFAQQAAEKAIKALLIEQRGGTLPRRSHDLEFLASEAGVLAPLQADLTTLAPVFEMARYPDHSGLAPANRIGHGDAQNHLDAAERIVAWIGGRL